MIYHIAALYRFITIAEPAALQALLREELAALHICGTLLIAPEGINGTLAGDAIAIATMLDILVGHTGLRKESVKFSTATLRPFTKLKIRLKREIITFNQPQVDAATQAGTYVTPEAWNALLAAPDITIIDTRNSYETALGSFAGALDPKIENFTDFADFVRNQLDPATHRKIAMFCTGGIRCEKASAFMRQEGFAEVYHLEGGILKYLETVPEPESQWQGDCYVFDKRVAVGHGLQPSPYEMCFCCGDPVTRQAKTSPDYELGVSCPACCSRTSMHDKARFRTRQQQLQTTALSSFRADNA
jgi:UPF0176 protein